MNALQRSRWRTLAGLALAMFVAPVVTAFCFNIAFCFDLTTSLMDMVGGFVSILLLAFLFGWLFAALPTLVFGAIAVIVARCVGTKSPIFYAAAGLLAGLVMAWVDSRRSHSIFNMLEAVPFLVGGCSSALGYWAVAERLPPPRAR